MMNVLVKVVGVLDTLVGICFHWNEDYQKAFREGFNEALSRPQQSTHETTVQRAECTVHGPLRRHDPRPVRDLKRTPQRRRHRR